MYEKSLDAFLKEPLVKKEKNLVIFEITLSNLLSEGKSMKLILWIELNYYAQWAHCYDF